MTEFLGDPKVGEVWQQLAQIITDESLPPDKIKLAVSNEHGVLNTSIVMAKHLFEQFFEIEKDGLKTGTYCRRVRITEIDGNNILIIRLNARSEPISVPQRMQKKIFLQTFYIPQYQMGQS